MEQRLWYYLCECECICVQTIITHIVKTDWRLSVITLLLIQLRGHEAVCQNNDILGSIKIACPGNQFATLWQPPVARQIYVFPNQPREKSLAVARLNQSEKGCCTKNHLLIALVTNRLLQSPIVSISKDPAFSLKTNGLLLQFTLKFPKFHCYLTSSLLAWQPQ